MRACPVKALPEGSWSYQVKLDGYRVLLIKDGPRVELRSRNNKDLTSMYPAIASAGSDIRAKQVIVDGEIVAIDEVGRPSFEGLQHRGCVPNHRIVFYAFDVIYADGCDCTSMPLEERRACLPRVLAGIEGLRVLQDLPGTAADVVAAVQKLGLEGIVAKRRGSIYKPGTQSSDWLKLKLDQQQEFVVGGYRPDGKSSFDVLVVGYYEGTRLRYAAKVRAGFVPHERRRLLALLAPLRQHDCPFADLPSSKSPWGAGVTSDEMNQIYWVRPETVVQIRFQQWTVDGRLRLGFYLGLRPDKTGRDIKRE